MKLLRVICFLLLIFYLGIAGSFFGLIALAMESNILFGLYIICIIPLVTYRKHIFSFCFGWISEDEV